MPKEILITKVISESSMDQFCKLAARKHAVSILSELADCGRVGFEDLKKSLAKKDIWVSSSIFWQTLNALIEFRCVMKDGGFDYRKKGGKYEITEKGRKALDHITREGQLFPDL